MLNTDDLRHYTGVGTGYSPEVMMQRAADEIDGLRRTAIQLLEILLKWEPDNSLDTDRQKILNAMYQVGILPDPMEIAQNIECVKG